MPEPRFDPPAPRSREELLAALAELADAIHAYLASFSPRDFTRPQGEAWSPAGHLRHLIKSVRPLAAGLRVPRVMLALRFGLAFGGSRSFEEVRRVYLAALGGGVQAGRFAPSPERADPPTAEHQASLLARWRATSGDLAAAAARWSDRALDRYRLPHPALGKLTAREMLFFTLYHNAHHARRVRERAAPAGAP